MNEAWLDLLNGSIDMVQQAPADQLKDIELLEGSPITILPGIARSTTYITFNFNDELVSNKKLRRALSMTMNREKIQEALSFKPAYSFAAPSKGSGWEDLCLGWCSLPEEEKVEQAKELMRDLGYSPFKRLKLTFNVNSSVKNNRLAHLLKEAWSRIWVDIKIDSRPSREHYINIRNKDYQVARAGWAADYDNPLTFLSILYPGSEKNHPNWVNDEYKKIIDELKSSITNQEESFETYKQLEKIIHEETPIAPVFYSPPRLSLLSSKYKEPDNLALDMPLFKYIKKKK